MPTNHLKIMTSSEEKEAKVENREPPDLSNAQYPDLQDKEIKMSHSLNSSQQLTKKHLTA